MCRGRHEEERADIRRGGYEEEWHEGLYEREGHGDDFASGYKPRRMEQGQGYCGSLADKGAESGSRAFRDEESSVTGDKSIG